MKQDPFGNLRDWGPVLDRLSELSENGDLAQCQPGLVRILRYKGNWRLREEVLKRIGEIQTPSEELVGQTLAIMADDNLYYDVRILAGNALVELLQKNGEDAPGKLNRAVQERAEKLSSTPQPPFFEKTLKRLCAEVGPAGT